jgi:hypothetical protein
MNELNQKSIVCCDSSVASHASLEYVDSFHPDLSRVRLLPVLDVSKRLTLLERLVLLACHHSALVGAQLVHEGVDCLLMCDGLIDCLLEERVDRLSNLG